MNIDNHAKIFMAYLARCSVNDLKKIQAAIDQGWYASLNLGSNAQLKAMDHELEVVKKVVGRWLEDDRNNVEIIVNRNI